MFWDPLGILSLSVSFNNHYNNKYPFFQKLHIWWCSEPWYKVECSAMQFSQYGFPPVPLSLGTPPPPPHTVAVHRPRLKQEYSVVILKEKLLVVCYPFISGDDKTFLKITWPETENTKKNLIATGVAQFQQNQHAITEDTFGSLLTSCIHLTSIRI